MTKDGLPESMHNDMEDKDNDYNSLKYEEWYDLLSTLEAKYNRKISAYQIKILAS